MPHGIINTAMLMGLGGLWGMLFFFVRASRKRSLSSLARAAIQSLGKIGDKRALSDLCYFVYADQHRAPVSAALDAILPTVTEADTMRLRSLELQWLAKAINQRASDFPDLPQKIARSLAHLGNAESLPVLERLAERGENESLREEARRAIPILRARLARLDEQRNLLRPSDIPQREYETLLRPYKFAKSEEGEQLLRSADPPE